MRPFASSHTRLRRLALGQRLVYTVFLLFSAVAVASAVLLYAAGPGWTLDSVRRYYRGDERGGAEPAATAGPSGSDARPGDRPAPAGPVIDLPAFNPANQTHEPVAIAHPRSYRELLENAHQHLFMMPVMFLVLAHLLLLSGLPRGWAWGLIGTSAFGVAGHIAAPWLIRYGGAGWAVLMPVTLAGLVGGLGGMIGISLVALWAGRRRPGEPATSDV